MAKQLEMNGLSTSTIAEDALRAVTMRTRSGRLEGPALQWEMAKDRLPRTPRVFVLVLAASVGDVAPFMRVVHVSHASLFKCMPRGEAKVDTIWNRISSRCCQERTSSTAPV